MTRAGVIPLSDIAQIQIYTGIVKNTKSGMLGILKDTGGTLVVNGPIFLRSLKPCCHLKVNGAVKCAPDYTAWGVSWNTPSDFCVKRVANSDASSTMLSMVRALGTAVLALASRPTTNTLKLWLMRTTRSRSSSPPPVSNPLALPQTPC